MLYQFVLNDIKVGMLSTINNIIDNKIIAATHTTADSLQINFCLTKWLNKVVNIVLWKLFLLINTIHDLDFNGEYSQDTRDHLDYHKTFQII